MSAANCHLAARMPHNAVWSAYSEGDAQATSQEASTKRINYIAATVERLICDFATTLDQQSNISRPRQHKDTTRASGLDIPAFIPASEDAILKAVYETQPGAAARVRVAPLSSSLTDAEKAAFTGDWISRAMGDVYVEESIKVLSSTP